MAGLEIEKKIQINDEKMVENNIDDNMEEAQDILRTRQQNKTAQPN